MIAGDPPLERVARMRDILTALDHRSELYEILNTAQDRGDALRELRARLGIGADSAVMLLGLSLEHLLPEYANELRTELRGAGG